MSIFNDSRLPSNIRVHTTSKADLLALAEAFEASGLGCASCVLREYREAWLMDGTQDNYISTFTLYLPFDYQGDASKFFALQEHLEAKFERVVALKLEQQAKARKLAA